VNCFFKKLKKKLIKLEAMNPHTYMGTMVSGGASGATSQLTVKISTQ
jgi:hypothetical protein